MRVPLTADSECTACDGKGIWQINGPNDSYWVLCRMCVSTSPSPTPAQEECTCGPEYRHDTSCPAWGTGRPRRSAQEEPRPSEVDPICDGSGTCAYGTQCRCPRPGEVDVEREEDPIGWWDRMNRDACDEVVAVVRAADRCRHRYDPMRQPFPEDFDALCTAIDTLRAKLRERRSG